MSGSVPVQMCRDPTGGIVPRAALGVLCCELLPACCDDGYCYSESYSRFAVPMSDSYSGFVVLGLLTSHSVATSAVLATQICCADCARRSVLPILCLCVRTSMYRDRTLMTKHDGIATTGAPCLQLRMPTWLALGCLCIFLCCWPKPSN